MSGARRWPDGTLLAQLPEPDRLALVNAGSLMSLPAGRMLMRYGEVGTAGYVLLHGCVKVFGNDGETEPLLAVRLGGDLVGEMALLTSGVRSATVVAATAVTAVQLHGGRFRRLLVERPALAVQVAAMVVERLRWANLRRVDFNAVGAPTRVARIVGALARAYGTETAAGWALRMRLTQRELASLAGVRLATVEKTLGELRRAGVLRTGYGRLVVVDIAALLRYGEALS